MLFDLESMKYVQYRTQELNGPLLFTLAWCDTYCANKIKVFNTFYHQTVTFTFGDCFGKSPSNWTFFQRQSISYLCLLRSHSPRSKPVLKASVSVRAADDISHSCCVFPSHLPCTETSQPTTKTDAASYHPSRPAFYGPSKDNDLPETEECLQHEVTVNTPDTD